MPAGGPGRPQLSIPQPRKVDRFGLCAYDCECPRCNLGFRPSMAERDAARSAFEHLESMRRAEAAGKAGVTPKAAGKAGRRRAAFAADEAFTDALIARLNAPVTEPATPEQLAELRKQYPHLTKGKKR